MTSTTGMQTACVIARIKGGLGNQLFCYAAARRVALYNDAELVIDDVSGFARDRQYSRQYALDCFAIPCRKATPRERMAPFDGVRRRIARWRARLRPYSLRSYVEEEGLDFDPRLLGLKFRGTLHLDGQWQSNRYFEDIEDVIRRELRIQAPQDQANRDMADQIRTSNAVCVHVRWFDHHAALNVGEDYYRRAALAMERVVENPHYFVFTNDFDRARIAVRFLGHDVTLVGHNTANELAYADLWLMTQCKHFIISNSTFSWWGAWLSTSPAKNIMCPGAISGKGEPLWSSPSVIPRGWTQIAA